MASAKYNYFIDLNKAPSNASKIGVYNSSGERVGGITIPQSSKIDLASLGEKQYSFGCISDIHLQYDTATDDFKKALTYFNENENVAFTCICGDLSKNGLESELQTYKEYVDTYSPSTPVYAISGNHEGFNSDILSILEKYTERPLYYSIEYENDVFVFCGIKASKEGELFTTEELQWLYETLEENRNKRVFLFSHVRPQDASGNAFGIYNYDIWGGNEQIIFESLVNHYKNVILFHGHSHLKFYLQYGVKNANIDTDFGMYSVHIPSLSVPRDGDASGASSRKEVYAESEGYVVDVYENGVVLKGRDFVAEKFVPIAYYQLNTDLKTISPKGYVDSTGTLDTGNAFGVETPITVTVGKTKTLNIVTNISNYSVSYSSSNTNIATVNSSGVVTGVAEGSCVITLTESKTGITTECEVNVLAESSGGDDNISTIMSISETYTFTDVSDTQFENQYNVTSGKKLYAKWDGMTYSGSNSVTEKIGVVISAYDSSDTKLGAVTDYQDYSNEIELTDKTDGTNIGTLSDISYLRVWVKSSSSSTASFPVTMTLDNFRIYTK